MAGLNSVVACAVLSAVIPMAQSAGDSGHYSKKITEKFVVRRFPSAPISTDFLNQEARTKEVFAHFISASLNLRKSAKSADLGVVRVLR